METLDCLLNNNNKKGDIYNNNKVISVVQQKNIICVSDSIGNGTINCQTCNACGSQEDRTEENHEKYWENDVATIFSDVLNEVETKSNIFKSFVYEDNKIDKNEEKKNSNHLNAINEMKHKKESYSKYDTKDAKTVNNELVETNNRTTTRTNSVEITAINTNAIKVDHLATDAAYESENNEPKNATAPSQPSLSSAEDENQPPAPLPPIARLPYTAWHRVLRLLSVADSLAALLAASSDPDAFDATLLYALEDPSLWKTLRLISRRSHPNAPFLPPHHGDLLLEIDLERIRPVSRGPLKRFVRHVERLEILVLKKHMESFVPFAFLVDSLDVGKIVCLKICLEDLVQRADLERAAEVVSHLTPACREVVLTRWPITRWRHLGGDFDVNVVRALLDNDNLRGLRRLRLGWFDYTDSEFWSIAHSRVFVTKMSWIWNGSQICRERNIVRAASHFRFLEELSVGGLDVFSESLLATLAADDDDEEDRKRSPLSRLDFVVNSWNGVRFATEDQRFRHVASWDALRRRHPALKIRAVVADEMTSAQAASIFGADNRIFLHEIHYLPFVDVEAGTLDLILERFGETLEVLRLHQETMQLTDGPLRDSLLRLVETCESLHSLDLASRFDAELAKSLMRSKGPKWRRLVLFEDQLEVETGKKGEEEEEEEEEGEEEDAATIAARAEAARKLETEGERILGRRWRLNERKRREEGPRTYSG